MRKVNIIRDGRPSRVGTRRNAPTGTVTRFTFVRREGFLESVEEIPEPHEFVARLSLGHGSHTHDYDVEYVEQEHAHAVSEYASLDVTAPGYQDPHELAHANDLRRRFANGM